MKINNRGFAITSIIYSMLILFLTLVVLILGNLASRKAVFDKQKEDILDKFEQYEKLPSEYQEVEYIESTGTQYINLGFKANQDTKIIVDAYTTTQTSTFGGTPGFLNVTANEVYIGSYFYWNGYPPGAKGMTTVIERTTFVFDKNKCYRNEKLVDEFTYSQWSDENEIYLFGRNLNGVLDDSGKTRIYSCKLYDNNILIRNMVPCYRILDNVIGMYDIENDVFYTNQGSGNFIIGSAL